MDGECKTKFSMRVEFKISFDCVFESTEKPFAKFLFLLYTIKEFVQESIGKRMENDYGDFRDMEKSGLR